MKFYVGLHQPSDAKHFARAMLSVNRLSGRDRSARRGGRTKPLGCPEWIMDSGAFSELARHGHYRTSVEAYATEISRWTAPSSGLVAAVSQDFMCEPFILARTGLTVREHQTRTLERYDELRRHKLPVTIIPVIQGYRPEEYAAHVEQYGSRLETGQWTGVGSVCKRNADPAAIVAVLNAIHGRRPDLRLHGFGLKSTALASPAVRSRLYSADSMAWSFAARKQGRQANAWQEAKVFSQKFEQD